MLHLYYPVMAVLNGVTVDGGLITVGGFIVQMQLCQFATGLFEGDEVGGRFHSRDARQLLAQIIAIADAVLCTMEKAVDVIRKALLWLLQVQDSSSESEPGPHL